ncbi:hypothetical protein GWI33_011669 [Rhynchophorus ferrugineus]|uniref:Nop domain-containing protein n=1 Tax=Rhynchophorus ferrugineus TaxID=354439 RepID=A0A834IJZ8_RHYFE|nr:hypothetical protein GWI33_011669 [Rhynchophorus ferrugineus]
MHIPFLFPGNTPKYGLLFHTTFIGRAGTKNKGRISRYLANKCSIASRINCFTEIPNQIFGEKLRQQVRDKTDVEDRLKFYETGEAPKKNIEVMQEAIQEVQQFISATEKKKKKKKKRAASEALNDSELNQSNGIQENDGAEQPPKKKKKKKSESESANNTLNESLGNSTSDAGEETPKKKKKKKAQETD